MKDTGVYRAVDEFGRFVIPKELRSVIGIEDDKDSADLYLIGDKLYCIKHGTVKNEVYISRKIDRLGRIVIPRGILKTLNFDINTDRFHIFTEGQKVVLVRKPCGCVFCGKTTNTEEYSGRLVCKSCLDILKNM